jgi:hypothetical protein
MRTSKSANSNSALDHHSVAPRIDSDTPSRVIPRQPPTAVQPGRIRGTIHITRNDKTWLRT